MERIGVIGGSGLYQLDRITKKEEVVVDTPFGQPSGKFVLAELEGREVVFLPRHGISHSINPSNVNYRANIYGMKKLGVGWIISVSACGSLKEELKPLDFVVPRQFVDRTNNARKNTFFDEGVVVHIGFAHPVCDCLADALCDAAKSAGIAIHDDGTYLNMEGPQFSTFAESSLYRSWGMDIIGMTNMTEARLAREAEICYSTLAAITDYDCWCQTEEAVSLDIILDNLRKNVDNSKKILLHAVRKIPKERKCECANALKYAIVTRPEAIPQAVKDKLKLLTGKYFR